MSAGNNVNNYLKINQLWRRGASVTLGPVKGITITPTPNPPGPFVEGGASQPFLSPSL
jgi:hypothetical protein